MKEPLQKNEAGNSECEQTPKKHVPSFFVYKTTLQPNSIAP